MNDYESRRLEKIRKNQALLAELDIKSVVPKQRQTESKLPTTKKRKLAHDTPAAPSRTSARIASSDSRPSYNEDELSKSKSIAEPRSTSKKSKSSRPSSTPIKPEPSDPQEPKLPAKDLETLRSSWTTWTPTAPPPTRSPSTATFHFPDFPDFTPNKSPSEIFREGAFGGTYYRPLYSRHLGLTIEEDWREDLPEEWIDGLNVEKYLTSSTYDPEVNKFGVACGQSIEAWEASGWIKHEFDVRGWMQWYVRFFRGRRCEDDERQVSRWKKCVGETGRWRRMLLKKYGQMGVRTVWDDGEEEEGREVSPVMHQTCLHWAFEVRQEVLDEYWANR